MERFSITTVTGRVRWFDPRRGLGFIKPDDDTPDIQMHVTALRAGGFQVAKQGAAITCSCINRSQGRQARCITHLDESQPHQESSDWREARVKWFNRPKGYGFLSVGEGAADIFCSITLLHDAGFIALSPGQKLWAKWGLHDGLLRATEIRPKL